jgi:hypothetical protein
LNAPDLAAQVLDAGRLHNRINLDLAACIPAGAG